MGAQFLAAKHQFDSATEQAIIEQCRRRDFVAFGKLIDAYQSRVLGFVRRRIRHEEEALDIAQEVFIKAYQAMPNFDGRSSLKSWLFRIAHNLCIDHVRKNGRQPQTLWLEQNDEAEPLDFADHRWEPESLAMNQELVDVVESAIESMSDKLRTVLLLHDREDMGYEEIAEIAQIPVGTVKSRLFLARTYLQKCVSEYLYQGGSK